MCLPAPPFIKSTVSTHFLPSLVFRILSNMDTLCLNVVMFLLHRLQFLPGSPPKLKDIKNNEQSGSHELFNQSIVQFVVFFFNTLYSTSSIYMNNAWVFFFYTGLQFTAYIMCGVSSIPRKSNHSCVYSCNIDPANGLKYSLLFTLLT